MYCYLKTDDCTKKIPYYQSSQTFTSDKDVQQDWKTIREDLV